MKEQLLKLIDAKAQSEIKYLHDELRRIRSEFTKNGTYASSMHVNSAIRACSDHAEKFSKDVFTDYKRAVSVDKHRFSKSHLDSTATSFLDLIQTEFKNLDFILAQAVSGIAQSLSNTGLQDYKGFEKTKEVTLQWLKAEIDLFHAEVISKKRSLGLKIKGFFQENIFGVILAGLIALASLGLAALKLVN
jgi:hypothetical protein